MNKLLEKRITKEEFSKIEEKRNRMFKVVYLHDDLFKMEKIFQKKKYVNQILNDSRNQNVQLYVGDVVESE